MIRAYTGPSRITDGQVDWIARDITRLARATEERYGAAHGVDSIAATVRPAVDPAARHVLYAPAAPANDELIERWEYELIQCAGGATYAAAYRIRNRTMVRGSGVLVAYLFSLNFYRSGEWMTVNIAIKNNVPVVYRVIPDL